jgi:hypothetical protein
VPVKQHNRKGEPKRFTTKRTKGSYPLSQPRIKQNEAKPLDYYLDIAKKVNPGLREYKIGRFSPFTVNCQRCVVTYEMRRRELKVKAKPVYCWQEKKKII